jgi:hypothetical protein
VCSHKPPHAAGCARASRIELGDLKSPQLPETPHNFRLLVPIQVDLRNVGVLKSQNTCFYFETDVPSAFVNFFSDSLNPHSGAYRNRAAFWELGVPLYPGMAIVATIELETLVSVSYDRLKENQTSPSWIATRNPGSDLEAAGCSWTLFADNALPKKGKSTLGDLHFNAQMRQMLGRYPNHLETHRNWGRLPK